MIFPRNKTIENYLFISFAKHLFYNRPLRFPLSIFGASRWDAKSIRICFYRTQIPTGLGTHAKEQKFMEIYG